MFIAAALVAPLTASADEYPTRPIRVIVPFSSGGGTDFIARTIFTGVAEKLGWTVVVENQGGASGSLGTNMVAKSDPDGYTIGLVSSSFVTNPSLYKTMPFDTEKDLEPVTLLVTAPGVLVVSPKLPVNSVKELIDLAKAKPGTLSFASAGVGTPPHLAGELFDTLAGVKMVHVPYKGIGDAYPDIIAGRVSLAFPTIPSAMPLVQSKDLKALAVTTLDRTSAAPDIPTLAEAGVPGYDASSWYGVVAPAGTPKEIVDKLQAAIASVLTVDKIQKVLVAQGLETVGSTPEVFGKRISDELAKWAKIIKEAGIAPQ
jgi:tripartite-type tricarboxylate transporter receptor subunit TctC